MRGSGFGSLALYPDRMIRRVLVVIAVLVTASVTGQYLKYFRGHDHVFGLLRLTYLNGEATIPSWYSSSALLACAATLAVIGMIKRAQKDRDTWYWFGLAAMFAYLSLDEGAAIHELWGREIKRHFAFTGFFLYAWVIPGSLLVVIVAAIYARFVWTLPAATRFLFVTAAALFVGGAVGVEMLSAQHRTVVGSTDNFAHTMLVTVEETGEMLGVALFLYAVLRYLATECGLIAVELRLREDSIAAKDVARVAPALDVRTVESGVV